MMMSVLRESPAQYAALGIGQVYVPLSWTMTWAPARAAAAATSPKTLLMVLSV